MVGKSNVTHTPSYLPKTPVPNTTIISFIILTTSGFLLQVLPTYCSSSHFLRRKILFLSETWNEHLCIDHTFSRVTKSLKLEWNLFWEGTVPHYVLPYKKFLNLIASSGCHYDSDCYYTATVKDCILLWLWGWIHLCQCRKVNALLPHPASDGPGGKAGLSSLSVNGELWSVFG